MPEIPPETKRIQSLLTSLIIITLVILALVLAIAAYPTIIKPALIPATPLIPSPRLSETPTWTPVDTPTLTPTYTPRPSVSPSITPTPSQTSTPTPTPRPPGPPTLTPAQPVLGDPYKLAEWTPNLANLSIELMNDYPNTLPAAARGDDLRGYYQAYFYATIAGREGLLRFPDDPLARQWDWSLAANLTRINDPSAGEKYADLIVSGLNRGEVTINGLVDWFSQQEKELQLNLFPVNPPSGFLSSHIAEVHGPGSAVIWLLETPSGYQSNVLESWFDFVNQPELRLIVSDLDGDGSDEVVIYNSTPDDTRLDPPRIYRLSEPPASQLSFRPSEPLFYPAIEYRNNWRIAKNDQGGNDLVLDINVFPACPVNIQQFYRWNGVYFERLDSDFTVSPSQTALSTCNFIVEHAASHWGPEAVIQMMTQLLPDWPPAENEQGKPYPADARDEWRYKLAIHHALLGNSTQAIKYLTEISQEPALPTSRWIEPARQALAIYTKPEDVYKLCTAVDFCDPNQAIDYLVNAAGIPEGQDPIEYLNQRGLTLRSSGYFDFDGDDLKERWFTVRHRPLAQLELWILAAARQGTRGIAVGPVEGDKPTLQFFDKEATPPIIWIDSGTFITFGRDSDTREPYIQRVSPKLEFPDRFAEALDQARQALFNGEDLNTVLKMLTDIEQSLGLLCKANWSCDEYYYLLGLVNELLGNERSAIEAYLRLWWDYSRSPFTTLARLKLLGTIIPPSPTPTATLTPLPTGFFTPGTPTASPGITRTLTPTLPGGVIPTATPTPETYQLPGATLYP